MYILHLHKHIYILVSQYCTKLLYINIYTCVSVLFVDFYEEKKMVSTKTVIIFPFLSLLYLVICFLEIIPNIEYKLLYIYIYTWFSVLYGYGIDFMKKKKELVNTM